MEAEPGSVSGDPRSVLRRVAARSRSLRDEHRRRGFRCRGRTAAKQGVQAGSRLIPCRPSRSRSERHRSRRHSSSSGSGTSCAIRAATATRGEAEVPESSRRRADPRRSAAVGCELERAASLRAGIRVAAERGVVLGELLVEVAVVHSCLGGPGYALLEGRRCLVRTPVREIALLDRIPGDLSPWARGSTRSWDLANACSNASNAPAASPASYRDQPTLL